MILAIKSALPTWLTSWADSWRAEDGLLFLCYLAIAIGMGWLIAQAMHVGGVWGDDDER